MTHCRRQAGQSCLDAVMIVAVVVASASLILEYGFDVVDTSSLARRGQFAAVLVFSLLIWGRLIASPFRAKHAREHIVALLISLAAVVVLIAFALGGYAFLARALQAFLLLEILSAMTRAGGLLLRSLLHPVRSIVIGFVLLIIVGSLLLSLPSASHRQRFTGWNDNYRDHLFTATSAVCVTGLVVRDTAEDYTPFGQLVILMLIQFGGLGIVLFGTMLVISFGKRMSVQDLGGIRKIVIIVLVSTLAIEAVGAVLLFDMWHDAELSTLGKVFKSVFHSVSAYCNAGFSLQADSLTEYAGSWQTYLVIAPLVVLGGLGLPVLIAAAFEHKAAVVLTSLLLIIVGTLAIFFLERPMGKQHWGRKIEYEDRAMELTDDIARHHGTGQRLLDAIFQSVSARSAGFNTVEIGSGGLSSATLLVMLALMMVGGAPGSTAGGMGIVTFVFVLATVTATLRRRRNVEVLGLSIDQAVIRKTMTLAILYVAFVWSLSLILAATHPQIGYLKLLFEAGSASGTVGYSTGVTHQLKAVGRICIMAGMFIGRLGPVTLMYCLMSRGMRD